MTYFPLPCHSTLPPDCGKNAAKRHAVNHFHKLSDTPSCRARTVTIDTIVRAETGSALRTPFDMIGFGAFLHLRSPTPLDNQTVVRMNRDTLYFTSILDLSLPVTITRPDVGDRYMRLHVINKDRDICRIIRVGKGLHIRCSKAAANHFLSLSGPRTG